MNEVLNNKKLAVAASLLALGGLAACSKGNFEKAPTRAPTPSFGYMLPGVQISFLPNGIVGRSTIKNGELTGDYSQLECSNGDLLTDTDPSNHNGSDGPRERPSITVSVEDQKCADNTLTPSDFNL